MQASDYVMAAATCVAFVLARHIGEVLDAAECIAAREGAMAQALTGGHPTTSVMGLNYEQLHERVARGGRCKHEIAVDGPHGLIIGYNLREKVLGSATWAG